MLWHICLCIYKTLPCFPTQPCIQFKNQTHEWNILSMGNMPMKFGYNLRTLKITHTRMSGHPYAYGWKWKFSKCFKISHTHFLDSREHAPWILAHLEQVDFHPYAYRCIPYAYDCKLEKWAYRWVFGLEIDRWWHILVYNSERNVPMCFGEEMCDGSRDMV